MMVLYNTNATISRMGFDSKSFQLMPRIVAIMISSDAGLCLTRLFEEKKQENNENDLQISIVRKR